MEIVAAFFDLQNLVSMLAAAIGLGFVIFVHELGHFAVAKWCGVRVERFSIGFGPVIWSYIKGETEYALSLIPFGGYVKMLGQDDIDPGQMTDQRVAMDPRSFTAKNVPQRMAIISAGVIMNLLTAPFFFAGALMLGQETIPSVIGLTIPGSPAWTAGIQAGDKLTEINKTPIETFQDITRRVMLDAGPLAIKGTHADGQAFSMSVMPTSGKNVPRPSLGVSPSQSLRLAREGAPFVLEGAAASKAEPKLEAGDTIQQINGTEVKDFYTLQQLMAKNRKEAVELTVEHAAQPGIPAKTEKVKIPPNPFRTLGLHMDIGQITAIRAGSPGDGKLQIGDKITHVILPGSAPREVGHDIDPLRLPSFLSEQHGKTVHLKVIRQAQGADSQSIEVELVPENRPGWLDPPLGGADSDTPMSIACIGVACHVLHTVLAVDKLPPGAVPPKAILATADKPKTEKTEAEKKDDPAEEPIKPSDQIRKLALIAKPGAKPDGISKSTFEIRFDKNMQNWPFAFWVMQLCPERTVKLTVARNGKEHDVEMTPYLSKDWFSPVRGMNFEVLTSFHKESSFPQALMTGVSQVRDFGYEIYLVLYSLFSQRLSWKELRGPIGIVGAAVSLSNQGLSHLLHFLGYLSVNLAVINFLPIPILDGGHMVFLLYEGLRGKPAPKQVIYAALSMGMAFLFGMIMLVLYLDIFVHWLHLAK